MSFRVNAIKASGMTQLGMDWGLCIGSLIIVLPTVWTVSNTTTAEQEAGYEPPEEYPSKTVDEK